MYCGDEKAVRSFRKIDSVDSLPIAINAAFREANITENSHENVLM